MPRSRVTSYVFALALAFVAGQEPAFAIGSSVNGAAIYTALPGAATNCANATCHGANPSANLNGTLAAANSVLALDNAISSVPEMAFLGPLLTSQQKDDLAAYLGSGNPAAGRILYRSITGTAISCAAAECHGITPGADTLGLSNGSNNPQRILDSIDANPAKQALRNFLSTQDVKDIAAYLAGDPVHGRVLYQNIPGAPRTCSASTCHGPDPSLNRRGFLVAANNPAAIFHQIEVNPRMRFLGNFLSTQDIKDVSAYLANLSVAASAGLPTQLDFGFQMVATTGPVHALPFTNVSGVQLNIASVTASGDFTLSHDCASILEPGQTCMLSLNFAPTASGSRQGQLIINDDAVGSPHAVALSGNGAAFPTNSGGGGCNISHSLPVDPTLPLGLVLAVAVLNYRRRRL